jgi:mono/diheme cytochrome c family protein
MRTARAILAALAAAAALVACGSGGRPAASPSAGSRLYVNNCLACHLAGGEGVPGVQPPLAGTPVPAGDPGELLRWVMFGERPAALPRGQYSGVMPQFGYLSDDDLATLLSYVRSSFGNHAAPITPAMVAAARAAHRDR